MDYVQDHGSPPPAEGPTAVQEPNDAGGTLSREERSYPDDNPNSDAAPPLKEKPQSQQPPSPEKPQEKPAGEEYRLQMPDGVQLDQDLLTSATPVLKELNLSNEQASKLVGLVPQIQERALTQMNDEFDMVCADWARQAKADPEIGGKHWHETSRLAAVALNAGGAADATHEVRQLLNDSRLGNHPAMIRLFYNIGKELEAMQSQSGNTARVSSMEKARDAHQKAIYPNDPPQRSFAEKVAATKARAPQSRLDTLYPDDKPRS